MQSSSSSSFVRGDRTRVTYRGPRSSKSSKDSGFSSDFRDRRNSTCKVHRISKNEKDQRFETLEVIGRSYSLRYNTQTVPNHRNRPEHYQTVVPEYSSSSSESIISTHDTFWRSSPSNPRSTRSSNKSIVSMCSITEQTETTSAEYFSCEKIKDLENKFRAFIMQNKNSITVNSFYFTGNQINIEYTIPPNTGSINKDELWLKLKKELMLSKKEIQLIEKSSLTAIRRTTRPGHKMTHVSPTDTIISAIVKAGEVNEESEEHHDRPSYKGFEYYALACGHDKLEGGEVTFERRNKRSQEESESSTRIKGTVEHVLFKDWETQESSISMDASLISVPKKEIKTYVSSQINGHSVRIYIEGVFETMGRDSKHIINTHVQTYTSIPVQGRIEAFPFNCPGTQVERPLFNALLIRSTDTEERKAIHGKGGSGMLVTTVFDEDAITQAENHKIVYVKAVGMLVATYDDSSLALPVDKTLQELEEYKVKGRKLSFAREHEKITDIPELLLLSSCINIRKQGKRK